MTVFSLWMLIGGVAAVVTGVLLVALVVRSVRKRPARRPVRTVVPAGRVYVSRAAAGAVKARDRVVAPPVMEAGATTYPHHPTWTGRAVRHPAVRSGRHRMAGAVR